MTLVKVCGVTRIEDAERLSRLVDYVGVIVHSSIETPRLVDARRAREIAEAAGRARPVAVAEGLEFEEALELATKIEFPILQYYGAPSERELERASSSFSNVSVAVAVFYTRAEELERALRLAEEELVEYALIDAPKRGALVYELGLKMPLELLARLGGRRRVGVAGGIKPSNAELVARFRPHLIDVSSGVESRPGVKDERLVLELLEAIRRALA
ncbi:MAG: hypothetical protein QW405_03360 [Fervidicoccaceae archaeon]